MKKSKLINSVTRPEYLKIRWRWFQLMLDGSLSTVFLYPKKKEKMEKENHEWMKLTWRRTRTNIFKWPVIKCYPWRHEWRWIFSIKFIKNIWKGNNVSAINDTLIGLIYHEKKKRCLRTIQENRITADELRKFVLGTYSPLSWHPFNF